MKDPVVVRIADEKKKTPAQVLLKYLMQRNVIVLPKSVSEHRIISNFEVHLILSHHMKIKTQDTFYHQGGWETKSMVSPGLVNS